MTRNTFPEPQPDSASYPLSRDLFSKIRLWNDFCLEANAIDVAKKLNPLYAQKNQSDYNILTL